MFRTLYTKLAAVLAVLLMLIGLLYAFFSTSVARHYLQEVGQRLNRDLARNLVSDRNLVEAGQLNETALKELFHQYMVINPSIEIYLLDLDGTILSYSADPGKVKRNRVSLEPIRAFLSGETKPLLGDDPRSHDRRKSFSVTQVPTAENPQGYLYVVLRGEEYDSIESVVRDSYILRLGVWAVIASLALGLAVGLIVFHFLTRRLHRLATIMDGFQRSDFTAYNAYASKRRPATDEIDRLGSTFDRMAERIVAQLGALQEQDTLRRELVAHVSHDLRTPLAALRGYLESLMMRDKELTEQERSEYLTIALRHSERLTRLVSELFELAKLDAMATQPHCEPFSPAELVQDVVQKYRLRAADRGIQLETGPLREVPFVAADIALIERALENLIENALEYTPRDGKVHIALEAAAESVVISVSDTGSGIAAEELSRIFEPFYRISNKRHGDHHAGLGLAITKRIVELHRGDIRVSSRTGEGTTFSFSLPIWRG